LLFARLPRGRKAGKSILMTIRTQGTRLKTAAAIVAGLIFLVLFYCPSSPAQEIPVHMELFGGYSYMHFDSPTLGFADYSNLNGGNLSLSVPHLFRARQYHPLGVVVDAGANYGSHLTVYNFLIGPQATVDKKGYTFFGRLMFGKSREHFSIQEVFFPGYSSLGRSIAVGGGVQKNWRSQIAIRIIQVDYIHNNNFALSQANLRISTGLVFQFGGK
jgi:hypothetical protein